VTRNCELFTPGRSYRDIGRDAFRLPDPYAAFEQPAIAHGIGLCNEYPLIMHSEYFDDEGFDGELEAGMVFCIESYAGAPGGREGVKLEQQVLVTGDGYELLSDLAFDADLLR
jgi:Xaa-Pro dipeptidase